MVMQGCFKETSLYFSLNKYSPIIVLAPVFLAAVACSRWFSSSLIILAISEALFSSNNNLKTAVSCLENFCDLKQLLI
jgi:hypothetical protein